MYMKTIFKRIPGNRLLVGGLLLAGLWGSALAATQPGLESMDGLVRAAYAHNPELESAYARWQASLARVPQMEAWPDPMLGYGYFIQRMETRQVFRVEQMFPGYGQRSARADAAQADAVVAAEQLEATAARIREQILQAGADYLFARRAASLVGENLELLEQLEAVANRRYRTGEASQADVLRLESEVATLRTERESWQEREAPLRARVNALIGRASSAPLPQDLRLPEWQDSSPAAESSTSWANNPDLRTAEARIAAAERGQRVARLESRPNLVFGIEYMDNRGMARDDVMAMVSVSLPVWQGRYRGLRREAAQNLRAAEADYRAAINRLEADASLTRFELRDALRQADLFSETLLPRARQTLALVESDYRTGQASFLDLLESQRSLLALELGEARAQTDAFKQFVTWERLQGSAPPALPTVRDRLAQP
ncbi:MAG: TolC family protein [Puniceicoccaceae bacterium]|nr:MAG: TolC family protein [Puniceicoccaceae bacterium]